MNSKLLFVASAISRLLPESSGLSLKRALYRWAGVKIGKNVRLYSSARILGNGEVEIGDDVHLGPEVLVYANKDAKIAIGSHVDIGPRVTLLAGGHEIDVQGEHVAGRGKAQKIVIENGCWVGACSTVLGGVTLRPKTVVAAGSVVTKSPDHGMCLIAGVPAVLKKVYA